MTTTSGLAVALYAGIGSTAVGLASTLLVMATLGWRDPIEVVARTIKELWTRLVGIAGIDFVGGVLAAIGVNRIKLPSEVSQLMIETPVLGYLGLGLIGFGLAGALPARESLKALGSSYGMPVRSSTPKQEALFLRLLLVSDIRERCLTLRSSVAAGVDARVRGAWEEAVAARDPRVTTLPKHCHRMEEVVPLPLRREAASAGAGKVVSLEKCAVLGFRLIDQEIYSPIEACLSLNLRRKPKIG